jgi:HD-GYP domain-containing protein (c-di-GMP phosphodiesterase class II)
MVARIGGDEFVILLPKSNEYQVEAACQRIREDIGEYNKVNPKIPLSLSIGFAISNSNTDSIGDLFKKADDRMCREKLNHRQSARSAIVKTLMKALAERDYITQGHADRMQNLVMNMAEVINLPKNKIIDLQLLAQFHDIGKVGVSDRILFKPGPLTPEEIIEMQRHSEIGYRIAVSAPDLVPIADWILRHHEWWNGKGYPLGLKEEEIPLECRILAIADAYDAMTNHRPYRKALSNTEVFEELKKCAGEQFDPELIAIFEKVIRYLGKT